MNTIEMRWCASKSWEESNQALKEQLSPETLENWKQARDYLSPDGGFVR